MGNANNSRNKNRDGSKSRPPLIDKKNLPPTASDPAIGSRPSDRKPRDSGFSLQLRKGRSNKVHPEIQEPLANTTSATTPPKTDPTPKNLAKPKTPSKNVKVAKSAEPLANESGIVKPIVPPRSNTLAVPKSPTRLLSSEKPFNVAINLFASKGARSTTFSITPSMKDLAKRAVFKEMNKTELNKINETLTRINTKTQLAKANKARTDVDVEEGLAGANKPPPTKLVPGVSLSLAKFKVVNETVPKNKGGVDTKAPPGSGTFLKAPVAAEESPSFTDPDIIVTGASQEAIPEPDLTRRKSRALSRVPTTSTVSIFLNDLKRQKGEVLIIPDPIMKPELISTVTDRLNILYSIMVFIATIIYGLFYFTWSIIPKLYCREAMLSIFLPNRMYANMFDMVFVPIFLSFLGALFSNIPDPKEWGCWKLRLNRFLRWCIYFAFVAYMCFMTATWIMDLTTIGAKLNATMFKSLRGVKIHADTDLQQIDDSQHYFRCCGVQKYTDWMMNLNGVVIEPEPNDTNKNVTFYPWSCCDSVNYPCDEQPTKDMIFTEGCYHYELTMVYSILGMCIACEIITILISLAGFFYVYVLEVLVLKVRDSEPIGEIDDRKKSK